jgi:hypothetical protein
LDWLSLVSPSEVDASTLTSPSGEFYEAGADMVAEKDAVISDLEDLHRKLDRAERMVGYISEKYAKAMGKNRFRNLRDRMKLAFSCSPIRASRYNLIRNSVFFDKNYYLSSNPDVKTAGIDPAIHYLLFGGKEGRDPGPHFSEREYLSLHPEVGLTSLTALEHYERYGRTEGRRNHA